MSTRAHDTDPRTESLIPMTPLHMEITNRMLGAFIRQSEDARLTCDAAVLKGRVERELGRRRRMRVGR